MSGQRSTAPSKNALFHIPLGRATFNTRYSFDT